MPKYNVPHPEPAHGSVVLVHGETGTAWQRFFSDGLWHSTTGQTLPWSGIVSLGEERRPLNLLVIHDVPPT